MNLAAKRCAWLRDDFVMRLGAFLMVIGLLFSLLNPPKAKAIAVSATVVTVAACFLASCGITWLVQGADETGFNDAVSGLLQDYLNVEFAGQTVTEWAGDFTGIAMSGSKLMLPKLIAQKLGAFAGWVVNKYSLTAGGSNVTVKAGQMALSLSDGSFFNLQYGNNWDVDLCGVGVLNIGENLELANGAKFLWSGNRLCFYESGSSSYSRSADFISTSSQLVSAFMYVMAEEGREGTWAIMYRVTSISDGSVGRSGIASTFKGVPLSLLQIVNVGEIAVSPSTALDITKPGTMVDNESLSIDTAITAGTLAELLERINAALRANQLTTTQEVVKEQVKPGEITDVNELGLPSLAAIITTRFPFSIPWDVAKGFKLLSAPAKTPHWEVDFYGAVSGMVPGGWKGDTRIVIDFSKFEVLGQLSRWTSTIGFCLFLAMGTKKLSWVS